MSLRVISLRHIARTRETTAMRGLQSSWPSRCRLLRAPSPPPITRPSCHSSGSPPLYRFHPCCPPLCFESLSAHSSSPPRPPLPSSFLLSPHALLPVPAAIASYMSMICIEALPLQGTGEGEHRNQRALEETLPYHAGQEAEATEEEEEDKRSVMPPYEMQNMVKMK